MYREVIGSQSGPAIHYGWDKLVGFDWKRHQTKPPKRRKK